MRKFTSLVLAVLMIATMSACSKKEPQPEAETTPQLEEQIHNIDNNETDIDNSEEKEESEQELPQYVEEVPSSTANIVTEEKKPEEQPQESTKQDTKVEERPQEATPQPEPTQPKEEPAPAPTPEPVPEQKPEPEPEPTPEPQKEKPTYKPVSADEMRAIWVSYLDLNSILKGKTKSSYTSAMKDVLDNMEESGFNTLILQVRPFSDAIYSSDYFPWAATASGTEGKNPGFDPLAIAVDLAHSRNMRIEAWINPYRIRTSAGISALCDGHVARELYEDGSDAVIEFNGGVYYNPASKDAQNLIINGVKEIVKNYDVDGIHFDDYFYPTTDSAFDSSSYKEYKNGGGKLALADWRRENVNDLVHDVYAAIKNINSSVDFGISPQGNMSNNYNAMFIDVDHWVSSKGYIDYIMPQIYFGFENAGQPYEKVIKDWESMCKGSSVELTVGLAPYKIGTEDKWAGSGKNEWLENDDVLQRMVLKARGCSSYGGFALFRYDSIYKPAASVSKQVKAELENLEDIM